MATLLADIQREARQLSSQDKERLVADLLTSLDDEPLSLVDDFWLAEVHRRAEQLRSRAVEGIPAGKVFGGGYWGE